MTARAKQLSLRLASPPVFTRAAFATSAANERAVALVEAWPRWPGGALALVGPEGAGKSHLAAIWAERAAAVRYDGAPPAEGRPVLVEDADQIGDEALFHLINRAPADGGLLLTARTRPAAWPAALPDLRSRLNAIRTFPVEAPDDAVLTAILEARFAERGIRPQKDVIPYLLRRIDRSAAAAANVVERLDALHKPVTRALARAVVDGTEESGELFDPADLPD